MPAHPDPHGADRDAAARLSPVPPEDRPGGPAAPFGPPRRQTTLASGAVLNGRGLHTGRRSTVRLHPLEAGRGVVFRRSDGPPGGAAAASWTRREAQPLCTALRLPDGRLVRTVEHLMAALRALSVDNVLVEVEGEELPIFDGSAVAWCEAIFAAGRVELPASRRVIRITKPFEHREGRRLIAVEPAETFGLDVQIALAHFGPLRWSGTPMGERFWAEIAPSRSFGRLKWALPLKIYSALTGRPILRGATFRSTAALVGGRIVGGARMPDEPVRHRALDLLGDLALAGAPLLGRVLALHPGHGVNHAFLAGLMAAKECWICEEVPDEA